VKFGVVMTIISFSTWDMTTDTTGPRPRGARNWMERGYEEARSTRPSLDVIA
jgi:hypothetical protein